MKFDQLIEDNWKNIFFKNRAENETGRLVPELLLFFKKALHELKVSGHWSVVSFQYNVKNLHLVDNKNKLHEALDH